MASPALSACACDLAGAGDLHGLQALDKTRFMSLTDPAVLGEGDTAKLEMKVRRRAARTHAQAARQSMPRLGGRVIKAFIKRASLRRVRGRCVRVRVLVCPSVRVVVAAIAAGCVPHRGGLPA